MVCVVVVLCLERATKFHYFLSWRWFDILINECIECMEQLCVTSRGDSHIKVTALLVGVFESDL